jgi:hypothetical protein
MPACAAGHRSAASSRSSPAVSSASARAWSRCATRRDRASRCTWARGRNFYNDLFAGYGYAAEAARIQDLYLSGRKKEAEAVIPSSYLDETSLVGSEAFVRDRLAEYRASGVTTLNVALVGRDLAERVRTLDRLRNLVEKA